ncbi:hypothetical protein pEaSNUABM17_00186 [Erwinia phage pEa_SNUABM_17]|uniref:Uncharacterized protein n=1 Tax=Erwinia phage pEa_SNUABM_17 TaxID=2869545 RepID=A0AAE8C029_9CAUD|nr:hypothetical protein MPK72_gp186 [Erwinia phage pEa_SNUABM_17]QZE57732.1 hypothetical protein pEaSNUABM17_00186 [Erwinia phage pEa_SNUABM_17]
MQYCCAQPDFRKFYARSDTLRWGFLFDSSKNEMDLSTTTDAIRTARSFLGYNTQGVCHPISGVADDRFIYLTTLPFRGPVSVSPTYTLSQVFDAYTIAGNPQIQQDTDNYVLSTLNYSQFNSGYHTVVVVPKKYDGRTFNTYLPPVYQSGITAAFNVGVTCYGLNLSNNMATLYGSATMPASTGYGSGVVTPIGTKAADLQFFNHLYSIGFPVIGGGSGYQVSLYHRSGPATLQQTTPRMQSTDAPERVTIDRLIQIKDGKTFMLDDNDFDASKTEIEPGRNMRLTPKLWKHTLML